MKKHLLAGLFVAVTIGLLAYLTEVTNHLLLITQFASTACIIFGLPESNAARVKNIVWSYLICTAFGFLALYAPINLTSLSMGLSVGAAVTLMLALDVAHPPAAGIPLFLMQREQDILFLFFPICAGLLVLIAAKFIFQKLVKTS